MSRTTVGSQRPREANLASGEQLLGVFASLGRGMKQWQLASMPTHGGLTVPRATLLLGLSLRTDPVGMSELGEALGMSPRNMTVLVDGLEKEGLARRVNHEHDRRIKLVELTHAGREVASRELGPSQATAVTVFDDLTREEQAELLRLLQNVADALRARGIDVAVPGRG